MIERADRQSRGSASKTSREEYLRGCEAQLAKQPGKRKRTKKSLAIVKRAIARGEKR